MPSLPEPHVWQPTDLAAAPPRSLRSRQHRLFEVSRPAATTPEEVHAPARAAAEAAGYAAGWAKGVQAAREVVHAEHESARRTTEARATELLQALSALQVAARRVDEQTVPALETLERVLMDAAFDLAEAIVGARLRDDEQRGPDALRRVLALANTGDPIRVHLNPGDLDVVRDADRPDGVELVADPAVAPGDAVARCGATEIDGRIASAVERVRQHVQAAR